VRVDKIELAAESQSFHVHFGAGRLGLGLVLPALQGSKVPFAILQRPSREWAELGNAEWQDSIAVDINGTQAQSLILINKNNQVPLPDPKDKLKTEDGKPLGYMVLSEDPQDWETLISRATSFSCAVGSPTWLAPYLQELPYTRLEARPTLYACENNHKSVRALKSMLHGKVTVVSCMVDRICAERSICSSGTIAIEAENHAGSIVMLEPPKQESDNEMPLGGDNVAVPTDSDVAEYFYQRKLLTVNGMHTTLAFMTLCEDFDAKKELTAELMDGLAPQGPSSPLTSWDGGEIEGYEDEDGEDVEEAEEIPDLMLLTEDTASEQLQEDMRLWSVANLVTLMSQFDLETMLKAHETEDEQVLFAELLQIAAENLERFTTVEDTTGRVLGGGVNLRYEGRLCNVQQMVSALDGELDMPQLRLLKAAGIELKDLQEACDDLVARSEKFSELDVAQREAAAAENQEWSLLPPGLVDNITTAYDDAILTLNEGVQDFKDDFLTPVGDSIMASFDSDALESMGNAITSSLDSFAIDAMDAIKQSFDPGYLDAVDFDVASVEAAGMSAGVLVMGAPVASVNESILEAAKDVAVLFDFDGTLGDTETPAMEVAYWELAPYFAGITAKDLTEEAKVAFIRENAGKAFEHMVEVADKDRKTAGLSTIAECKAAKGEDADVLAAVDVYRAKFGLPTFAAMRAGEADEPADFLTMQKDETVLALRTLATACPGVPNTLAALRQLGVRFAIATTSGKPRVPVSVVAANLEEYFPPDKIHSGESDFDPPRFKPDPDVYLLAAESEGIAPENAVAVEDSASGVGSASNANVGFIVGYVGGTHVADELKESHARMLMRGERATSGRGAEMVISDMKDLSTLVAFFAMQRKAGKSAPFDFPLEDLGLTGTFYLPE